MAMIRACLLSLFIAFSLEINCVFAKGVDLKTIAVSVPTPHGVLLAEIHFDERDLSVAAKVQQVIAHDLINVINYFKYVPRSIVHFNVDPYMRMPNGNARVFPDTTINLFNFPANNADHLIAMEDWLKGLVLHEFVHVTHLDQTRGYLEVGRDIFGSIAKLPAHVVPRWFTEGIAVWGESHLMKGGRLNNPLFRKELLIQFLREDYCHSIDCLDEPGVYPHGQLAYWAGAHFIEYLENLRPDSIRCLVEFNSSEIPAFLNHAFNGCTGATAQVHFRQFREKLIGEANFDVHSKEIWGDKISNAFGSDDFQKGVVLDGHLLYKVERDRYTEALVSYDLTEPNALNLMIQKYPRPISDLVGTVNFKGNEGETTRFLLTAFIDDPNFRKESKKWKLVNAETLLVERELAFKNDPLYVLALGNNAFLTACYVDNLWRLQKQTLNDQGEFLALEELRQFAPQFNVVSLQMAGQKIFLKINDGKETSLVATDVTLQELKKIHSSENYFNLLVLQESYLVINEMGTYHLVEFNGHRSQATFSLMDKNVLKHVTFSLQNEQRVVWLENRLKTKAIGLKDGLEFLKSGHSDVQTKELPAVDFVPAAPTAAPLATENYPQLYHLSPHYWFLASGGGENITSYGAMTSVNDPMNIHAVNATVLLFPSISKAGGSLDYFHKFSSISDLWQANAFFQQDYSRTEINSTLKEAREFGAGTSYSFLLNKWTETPGLFFSRATTRDFISDRTTNSMGLRNMLVYQAQSFDDVLQSFSQQLKLQADNPNRGNNFFNLQMRIDTDFRFSERFMGKIKASYGRLFKNDFNRGVLYGGGITTVAAQRWFEFYGVPYSNAFGNEIFTFKLQGDYNFWNIYRGHNFFPLFLKEAHFLFGRESLYADRIFLDNELIREKSVNAVFVGLRLKTNFLYYVPTDFDLIYSNTAHPNGKSIKAINFTINAEVF